MWKMVQIVNNQHGVVMLVSLLVMALLTLVGMSALSTSDVELAIAANTKANKMAYYNGEAGLEYTRGVLQNSLNLNTYTAPDGTSQNLNTVVEGNSATYLNPTYSAPTGFNFTSSVVIHGTYPGNIFDITSVGTGPDNATVTIAASFARSLQDANDYGLYGDELVDLRANTKVYSYDSCAGESPPTGIGDGNGNIGSNASVVVHDGTIVDGNVVLGVGDDGSQATLSAGGDYTITGEAGLLLSEAEDSDPRGMLSSGIFAEKAVINNNGTLPTDLTVSGTVTLTAGDYYFTSIIFSGPGATLNISTTPGEEVNIYLSGPLTTTNSAALNTTGTPTQFAIYSNSTDAITLRHTTNFSGLIYAPLATVEFKQGGVLNGIVSGNSLILHEDTTVNADKCLYTGTPTPSEPARLTPLWWKEVRN